MPDLGVRILLWVCVAIVTTMIVDRLSLWLIIRCVSRRALRRHRNQAGGSNQLVFHGVNTADNCRTPMSIADAIICYCVYDLSAGPVLINAVVPPGRCWSLSCYGTDTTCFYTLNHRSPETANGHLRLRLRGTQSIESGHSDVTVDTVNSTGIVLIRTLLDDPSDLREQQDVMLLLLLQTSVERQSPGAA